MGAKLPNVLRRSLIAVAMALSAVAQANTATNAASDVMKRVFPSIARKFRFEQIEADSPSYRSSRSISSQSTLVLSACKSNDQEPASCETSGI